MMNLLINFIS